MAITPNSIMPVLRIVHRAIHTHLVKQTGVPRDAAATGTIIPVMIRMPGILETILDKAIAHTAARKIEGIPFVEARPFPDVFDFAR